jgi:hypothetical protein
MPQEWFAMPPRDKLKSSLWASLGALAFSRAMEERDFQRAKDLGAELVDNAPGLLGLHRNYIKLELVLVALLEGADKQAVDAMLDKELSKTLKAKTSLASLRAAFAYELLINGDESACDRLRNDFEKLASRHPYLKEVEGERSLLELVLKRHEELTK